MNINVFFTIVLIGMFFILSFFKPMQITMAKNEEVAKVEINSFTIHELDRKKLITYMDGSKAFIYDDRYEVFDVDYTDASKNYVANIKSKKGVYKDPEIDLDGDVVYTRVDGLVFESDSLVYNQKTGLAYTDKSYVIYNGDDVVRGTSLRYNNNLNNVYSKNVNAVYNLKER